MNNNIQKQTTRTRRAAMMLCAVLAGLGLARGAAAQQPQAGSPSTPTAYQSPLFHSGGSDPALVLTPPFTTPLPTPPFLNPLYGQLQGTPTETIAVPAAGGGTQLIPVQIPSFLLGAYDPAFPPAGIGTYYPEHFADGQDPPFSWNAPFSYVPVTAGLQTVDDSAPAFTDATTSGFTATSGWQPVTIDGTNASPAAGTATNGEYLRLPPNTDGTAVWQILEPTAGSYTVNVNIPNDIPDAGGVIEPRSSDVGYSIVVRDAGGVVTFSGTSIISQTEANANQFLGGPFQVVANGTVTVTLERSAAAGLNNTSSTQSPRSNYDLVADSVTLQIATGDVQSTPTAINRESFPLDFARAKYWGIQVAAAAASPVPQTVGLTAASNSVPDTNAGTPVYQSGAIVSTDRNTNDPGNTETVHAVDALHKIRQLVYFGRREPILTRAVSLDDSQAGFSSPPTGPFSDPSATAGEYRRYSAAVGTYSAGRVPAAFWTLTVPPNTAASGYFVNVHLPRTQPANANGSPNEVRLGQVTYTITDAATGAVISGPVTVSQQTFGTDRVVTLPTGPLTTLTAGQNININLFNITGNNNPLPAGTAGITDVVADSVSLTTGNGKGAVYCVDGFTGGVVWRFEIPSTPAGDSSPVYSSPAVARVNVLIAPATGTTPARYANRLVVIVGDNNGLLYCLDAMGNGDGTSNFNSLDANGQPIYAAQPAYAPFTGTNGLPTNAPLQVDAAGYVPHVGTTGVYWVYRPDPNGPKDPTTGAIKRTPDVNSDLPVPAAFNTASATVFVDPNVPTASDATGSIPVTAGQPISNAIVYVGNSNGVLYALDALGVPTGGDTQAAFQASGEKFNASLDIRPSTGHFKFKADGTTPDPLYNPADTFVPTPQPKWWFTLRGPDPDSPNNTLFADIESAPAVYTKVTQTSGGVGAGATTYSYAPIVFIGSAHEMEANSNVGRLYSLDGLLGPSGNNGQSNPDAAGTTPGTFNYNVGQRPQTSSADTAHWSFPDAYDTTRGGAHTSSNKLPRPALGNISGSPVVFTNTHETQATRRTRVYFAANSGLETTTNGVKATTRPDETQTGRVWAVNLDGTVGTSTNSATGVWAFPSANDPNIAANDTVVEPSTAAQLAPMGSFLHATPALGFVQFPATILNGDSSPYNQTDTTGVDVKGRSVPMLYVATRGVNDTALYALNIDGGDDTQRLIYRQPSFDGSIFQSSPVLITNTNSIGSGNGGSVFVTAGTSFFDYSATPISNPDPTKSQNFPLIRLDKVYTSYGPFSSPTVAATDTTDLLTTVELNAYTAATGRTTTITDWVYVGDSTLGFCRGFTPRDSADTGIPATGLSQLIPPDPNAPAATDLSAPLQAYLVTEQNKRSTRYSDHLPFGKQSDGTYAPLPVYDWGQSVYIRFANVVPPTTDTTRFVYDHTLTPTPGNPITAYGKGGPLQFDLSDAAQGTNGADATPADHAVIPPVVITVPGSAANPLPNGFIQRGDTDTVNVLQDSSGRQYIGAYTYTIADGSARLNTPGSRRRVINATQTVEVYSYNGTSFADQNRTAKLVAFSSNGNEVTTPNPGGSPPYKLTAVPPVDQPTFGILNPLGVRGGGMDLLGSLTGHNPNTATVIGDELGPFRGIGTPTISNNPDDLKALANGNDIPVTAPPSTTGGGGGTIPTRPRASNTALDPNTTPNVVVTATGLINHNTTGDNVEAVPASSPPQGTGTSGSGLNEQSFGSTAAPYAMDLFDRSALGVIAQGIRAKANTISGGGDAGLYWNDNTANTTGHDSVVNYLPWETPPPAGSFLNGTSNFSQDYPNISPSNVSVILHQPSGGSADMSLGQAFLARSVAGTGTDPVTGRTVFGNPVQFHVIVPRFQSANQQLYVQIPIIGTSATSNYNAFGQIAAVDASGNTNPSFTQSSNAFPMGYVTTRRIYVPDRNGFYRQGAAFREVRVYTGVPPSYTTQMGDATATVGKVPSGFGIQTSLFTPLTGAYPPMAQAANPPGAFDPYRTFDPYNPQFRDYFKSLNVLNTGNVNLLNVHLDQKQSRPVNGGQAFVALALSSDAVDPLSLIPGYDQVGNQKGILTGPRKGQFGQNDLPEDYYLIRSSLDTDLVAPYGHNPTIQNAGNKDALGVPLSQIYPGATFHKAQVGSAQPSTLTVPDAPDSFTPGASLDVPPLDPAFPAVDNEPHPTQQRDPNNLLAFKTKPFVSTAIPFGTPVGSYHGLIQLFEGLDANGYSNTVIDNQNGNQPGGGGTYTGLLAQLYPPHYGGSTGGIGAPAPGGLADIFTVGKLPGQAEVGLMPTSTNSTTLNVNVVEDRMTDGTTYGTLSMVDPPKTPGAAPTLPASFPDFAPAAFRDPTTGNISMYWTSGRVNPGFGIYSATVPVLPGTQAFMPVDPFTTGTVAAPNYVDQWWTSQGNNSSGYTGSGASKALVPAIPTNQGTNSGLSIAQDAQTPTQIGAFVVNVQGPPLAGVNSYQNTLLFYPVTSATGALGTTPQVVTNDPSQVKSGVKGLIMDANLTKFNRNLWAFWTATTRGRTAIYYNSQDPANNSWLPASATAPSTTGLLTIPAGLTAVADPAPLLVFGNVLVNGALQTQATIEVTYSGTSPTGNVDLYQSRYQPEAAQAAAGQRPTKPYQLDLLPYPAVTEILKAQAGLPGQPSGWYQARDVAWSRTNQLNLFVQYVSSGGQLITTPLLYDTSKNPATPLFSRATFDKASGLLVVTGLTNPALSTTPAMQAFGNSNAPVTAYIDLASGRVRFSATPNVTLTALFSPLARRLTDDSRANTGPVTFLDGQPGHLAGSPTKDRRWYVWRKSGAGGAASPASLYYKTQRLTVFLAYPVDTTKPFTIMIGGTGYTPSVDVYNVPAVPNADGSIKYPASSRMYFPIYNGAQYCPEGQSYTVSYTDTNGQPRVWPQPGTIDTVQWQDEIKSNDTAAPPTSATAGLSEVLPGYQVPIDVAVNENNVSAFLDPFAGANTEHKVWVFWNSTRNGTADVYYETINPLFEPGQ